MCDTWSATPSGMATLAPPDMNWEIPPSGSGAVPPEWSVGTPTPPPPPRPPARGARGMALALVVAVVAGFLGVTYLRSSPPSVDTSLFAPARPSAAAPAPSGTSGLSSSAISAAVAKIDQGVVNIDTVLGFEGARAAGTGMVLTASGEVLTNNHVIQGATKITATVVATGKSYSAQVVGTDPTGDVAVIQLVGASGLRTISTAKLSTVNVGDPVIAVGNAGGKGGTPSVATGSVTSLNQSITASDPNGANAQRLTGLIEVDAPIQAGDSGGPLANRNGDVIGMDSAAEVSGARFRPTTGRGYAIPIEKALSIAGQIEAGNASPTIHIGLPAFLGVQLAGAARGGGAALVTGVEPGTPAASIGLARGDTITSINGTAVGGATSLSSLLQSQRVGDRVIVGWTDPFGGTHSATATLVAGPAD